MERRCDQCLYWVAHGQYSEPSQDDLDDMPGACHRYPPQKVELKGSEFEAWEEAAQWVSPVTCGMDWCGEFERKEG